jgi:hypothetical protein
MSKSIFVVFSAAWFFIATEGNAAAYCPPVHTPLINHPCICAVPTLKFCPKIIDMCPVPVLPMC